MRPKSLDMEGSWEDFCCRQPRILFIDAYDSFSNNIVSLLETLLGVKVYIVHQDLTLLDGSRKLTDDEFLSYLPAFDAVVCGPGPGSPLNDGDVGAFKLLWDLEESHLIPVFGICLGFQSLAAHFGGNIRKLRRGLHGMMRVIEHRGSECKDIFRNVAPFRATLYHSLCADIGQDDVPEHQWKAKQARWMPSASAPELVPLAWVTERSVNGEERILMGVRHREKPFWGVQYHPESICTDHKGNQVVKNWFDEVKRWNSRNRQTREFVQTPGVEALETRMPNLHHLLQGNDFMVRPRAEHGGGGQDPLSEGPSLLAGHELAVPKEDAQYCFIEIPLPRGVGAPEVAEALGVGRGDSIVLDSSSANNGDSLAKNSVIALDVEHATKFYYHVGDNTVVAHDPATKKYYDIWSHSGAKAAKKVESYIWMIMSYYLSLRAHPHGSEDNPCVFKGGFMGLVSYEWGLQSLNPDLVGHERGHHRPDVCFAWVTRSVVLDHQKGIAYVQSIGNSVAESRWVEETALLLQSSTQWASQPFYTNGTPQKDLGRDLSHLDVQTPLHDVYASKVEVCQDFIAAGQSYELCLTDQTTMSRPVGDDTPEYLRDHNDDNDGPRRNSPWSIYKTLRNRQPAPFGSFIRLGGATIISSSPERFLTHDKQGLCSMRPMKGTVRKSEAVQTLTQAQKILHIPKEQAENLMIVDLVRHDLYKVCGSGGVTVSDLMKVEEYATVFQMISVVNGKMPLYQALGEEAQGEHLPNTGFDVLTAALPPGSMTGAPKKRSCEILHSIEHDSGERSLYSGVVGYLDVTGHGDWSVTIRTMFRWDDEKDAPRQGETAEREVWHIGAGGAVTILSTPEGETEEMFTKLLGPLGVFKDMA